jgi:plastocyanin
MKKTILLFSFFSIFAASCAYDKAEAPKPIAGCVNDSTIDVVNVQMIDPTLFSPALIEIAVGDTVKWTNNSTMPHTVTCDGSSGSSLPHGASTFDSGISTSINVGDTYKVAISVPGTYTYICLYHTGNPGMSGTIIVKPRCK